MLPEDKKINNAEEKETKTSFKNILGLFNSNWLTGNMNFFLFLCLLTVIYIANGHWADKTVRNINKTENELKDLQFEYKTVKSELMFKSEEAQVLKVAEPLGLKISNEIPQRLQLQKTKGLLK
jgi:cell division protein FtsL